MVSNAEGRRKQKHRSRRIKKKWEIDKTDKRHNCGDKVFRKMYLELSERVERRRAAAGWREYTVHCSMCSNPARQHNHSKRGKDMRSCNI